MEQRASYLLVGAFVLTLMAGLFAFVLWLAHSSFEEAEAQYRIYFRGSVTGLQEGSAVRYRGVPVGRVTDIRIDPGNVERVQVTISVPEDLPIKRDAIAALELQGLTGQAYVQITGGSQAAPDLKAEGGEVPVIPSRPSSLAAVVESAPELLGNLIRLSEQAQNLLSPENQQAVAETLENARRLSAALADTATVARGTLGNVDTTLTEAKGLISDLRGHTNTIGNQVGQAAEKLNLTSGDLATLIANLNRATGQIEDILQENRRPISDFTRTGLYDFSQLVVELRDLTASLQRLAVRIERNPADFFLGSSRRGVEVE